MNSKKNLLLIFQMPYLFLIILGNGLFIQKILFKKKYSLNVHTFIAGFWILSILGLLTNILGIFNSIMPILILFSLIGWLFTIKNKKIKTIKYSPSHLILFFSISLPIIFSFLLKFPLSEFLFSIGDPGEYLNSGNNLYLTGRINTTFFPLTVIWIGLSNHLFSIKNNLIIFPIVTTLNAIIFYKLLLVMIGKKSAYLGFLLFSSSFLVMWQSKFPYSEHITMLINVFLMYLYLKKKESNLFNPTICSITMLTQLAILNRINGLIWLIIPSIDIIIGLFKYKKEKLIKEMRFTTILFGTSTFSVLYISFFNKEVLNRYLDISLNLFVLIYFLVLIFLLFSTNKIASIYNLTKKIKISNNIIFNKKIHVIIQILSILLLIVYLYPRIDINAVINHKSDNNLIYSYIHIFYYTAIQQNRVLAYFSFIYFSFFSFLALIIMFNKIITLIYKKDAHYIIFFFFLNIVILKDRFTSIVNRGHLILLYWHRYMYPNLYLSLIIFISILIHLLYKKKYFVYKLIALIIFSSIIYKNLTLIKKYNSFSYLADSEQMLTDLSYYSSNKTIFLHTTNSSDWMFPNFRRTILLPLSHSFGKKVHYPDNLSPFSKDIQINPIIFNKKLLNEKSLQVITLSNNNPILPSFLSQNEYKKELLFENNYDISIIKHNPIIEKSKKKSYKINVKLYEIKY